MASGTDVSFMVNERSSAVAKGNAIPSCGGIEGRLLSPATCSATVVATARQISVGSSFTTSVRCWVVDPVVVSFPLEQAASIRARAAADGRRRAGTGAGYAGSPGTPGS